MEVVVRKIEIRGEDEYIVDIRGGLPMEKQLDILLQASYNTILTSSEFAKKENSANSEKREAINELRDAVKKYLNVS